MNKKTSDSVVQAWIALVKTQQIALQIVEQAFKDAGLPALNVYDVLWELDKAGDAGLRPFEIEQQMLVTQWNLSRLLDKLNREHFIERRPVKGDGRGHFVVITESGKELRQRMWIVYEPAISEAMGGNLQDSDAKMIARLLQKLRADHN